MMNRKRGLLAAAMALICATSAFAQTQGPGVLVVKDASQRPISLAGYYDLSGNYHYADVFQGLSASGAPTSATINTDSGLQVHLTNGPVGYALDASVTGAATQAHTDSGALLSAIGGLLPTGGYATATGQASALTQLQAIAASTAAGATAAGQGTAHTDAAAILAKQPTAPALESGHLANVDTNTANAHSDATAQLTQLQAAVGALQAQLSVKQPDALTTGSIAAATLNNAFTVSLANGQATTAFAVSGLAASGATLTVQGSNDGGTTWTPLNEVLLNNALQATITADGQFRFNTAGRTKIRLIVTAVGTGSITVAANASSATGVVSDPSLLVVAANQLGTANFAPGQVTITTTVTPIASARTGRRSLTIENTSTTPIYLGGPGVTALTGFLLPGVAGASLTINFQGALYGITASGAAATTEYELY